MSDFTCPYCGREYTVGLDELYDLVTYWGEGEPVVIDCFVCERKFKVDESVSRTFEVTAIEPK